MIEFNSDVLDNGLKLLHHKDATTKMVALNILYKVGARNEVEGRTGFAHLFEHLMFGGSVNIPSFDESLNAAGGESNAWTSSDITNFYDIIPSQNVETAFWLESDRLFQLAFSQQNLDTQKSVVMEEFKQRCLNVPYGDLHHIIADNAYKMHPYRWPVIGRKLEEIESVTLDAVKDFFYSHYGPDNIIMCVAGDISFEKAIDLTEKWFGPIPSRNIQIPVIPQEPMQSSPRIKRVVKDVPNDMIVKSYHMCSRGDKDYQTSDIISDLLANGNSARFFKNILMKTEVFVDLDATVGEQIDPGLLNIKGRLRDGVSYEEAEMVIKNELDDFMANGASEYEITKFVNKWESTRCFENISYFEKAVKLCYYDLISYADDINKEIDKYRAITQDDVVRVARNLFREDNCCTVYYGKNA